MEPINFDLRTKIMVKILKPIINKVQEFSLFKTDENDCIKIDPKRVCCILKEIYSSFFECPEFERLEHFENIKLQLRSSLEDFNIASDHIQFQVENVTSTQVQNVIKNLLVSLYKILLLEDNMTNKKVEESVTKCQTSLSKLQNATGADVIVTFKEFVEDVLKCKNLLRARALSLVSQKQGNLILLCESQIHKCISLMLKVYKTERLTDSVTYKESLHYILSRLNWCFSELLNVITEPAIKEEAEESDGQFVNRMDLILEMLASIKVEEEFESLIPQVKHIMEELLSHAMAIAQVSSSNDSTSITISCQKVLKCFEDIKKESACQTVNLSVRQLYTYSFADALESLEHQVNNALLRLVLEVFCDSCAPLKTLVQASCNSLAVKRSAEDLNDIVTMLDLHMDRIMQIGMFAMACSGDMQRVLRIRSCLASLESLEAELVPAFTSYYLENDSYIEKNHLRMLSDHWQSEILELEKLIDGIVDPAAFCQVIYEEVQKLVAKLTVALKKDKTLTNSLLYEIYKKSSKLVKHLHVSTKEMEPFTSDLKISDKIEEVHKACEECSPASNIFLESHSSDILIYHTRLMKRCKLVVSLMKKLQPLLFELVNQCSQSLEDTKYNGSSQVNLLNKEDDTLFFPDSVRDLPVDISTPLKKDMLSGDIDFKELKLSDLHLDTEAALLPYREKGKRLCQERSILYQTPKSVKKQSQMKPHPLQYCGKPKTKRRLFSRDDSLNTDFTEVSLLESSVNETLGLEITDILDNLTSLSSTLTPLTCSESQQHISNEKKCV